MYHEKQRGGLCKMHSVNNAVGYALVDEKKFNNISKLFDSLNQANNLTLKGFDSVNFYRELSPVFILRVLKRYPSVTLFNENEMKELGLKLHDLLSESIATISWTKTHIFAFRKVNKKYYNFDSQLTPRIQTASLSRPCSFIFSRPPIKILKALRNSEKSAFHLMYINFIATFYKKSDIRKKELNLKSENDIDLFIKNSLNLIDQTF